MVLGVFRFGTKGRMSNGPGQISNQRSGVRHGLPYHYDSWATEYALLPIDRTGGRLIITHLAWITGRMSNGRLANFPSSTKLVKMIHCRLAHCITNSFIALKMLKKLITQDIIGYHLIYNCLKMYNVLRNHIICFLTVLKKIIINRRYYTVSCNVQFFNVI